jgi:hypothetical protein
LPEIFLAAFIRVTEPLPKLEVAELIPEVEMIQVEILGTVNMHTAPIINTTITVPKEIAPLPVSSNNFVMFAELPSGPISSLYLLISEVMAYFCIKAMIYMMR